MPGFIISSLYYRLFWFAIIGLMGHPCLAETYFASPNGISSNLGLSRTEPQDIFSGLSKLKPGDSLILAPGIYSIPFEKNVKNTLTLSEKGSAAKPITVLRDSSASHSGIGFAVLDFSFPPQEWVQDGFGLLVSGDYWKFVGIAITRAGYQGAYVTGLHNTFDRCAFYENRNSGLEINKGGSFTTVLHCDAYRNYDPKKLGSMADGFAPKQTQGPGNRFIDCRAWENSDDGFDTYDSPDSVVFENCWAFRNGIDIWNYGGFSGNGNGFKAGGNGKLANNRLVNCIAFSQPQKGFDQNNNTGGITLLNCLAYQNGTNFGLGGGLAAGQNHLIRNCVSMGGGEDIANAIQDHNSWNLGFTPKPSDFASLDTALATMFRQGDGKIPENNLFRLMEGSRFINAGVNVQLPFAGVAPDLGAFEWKVEPSTKLAIIRVGSNHLQPNHFSNFREWVNSRNVLGRLQVTSFKSPVFIQ